MGGGEDVSVVDEGSAAELLRAVHERRLPRPLVHARGHPAHDPGGGLLPTPTRVVEVDARLDWN